MELIGLGHQVVQVAPDGLVGRVAEQPLGRLVPGDHRPLEVGDDDGARTDLEHRLEALLLAPKLILEVSPGSFGLSAA